MQAELDFLFIKWQDWILATSLKKTPAQLFLCEFYQIFKDSVLAEIIRLTASVSSGYSKQEGATETGLSASLTALNL